MKFIADETRLTFVWTVEAGWDGVTNRIFLLPTCYSAAQLISCGWIQEALMVFHCECSISVNQANALNTTVSQEGMDIPSALGLHTNKLSHFSNRLR